MSETPAPGRGMGAKEGLLFCRARWAQTKESNAGRGLRVDSTQITLMVKVQKSWAHSKTGSATGLLSCPVKGTEQHVLLGVLSHAQSLLLPLYTPMAFRAPAPLNPAPHKSDPWLDAPLPCTVLQPGPLI